MSLVTDAVETDRNIVGNFKRFLKLSTDDDDTKIIEYNPPPSSYESFDYNMSNRDRGHALIFNHENFATFKKLSKRLGTHEDCARVEKMLKGLHFKVSIFQDFKLAQINEEVRKVAEDEDHTHHDCLVIVIMSHGDEGDLIHSYDDEYKLESITEKFKADRCKTLAGKPKLFFVQACRGSRGDRGAQGHKDQRQTKNGPSYIYRIPINADFLVMCSTVPGYVSWRDTIDGSWFIQTLCKELEENGTKQELMKVLTMVNRRIAHEYEALDCYKQMPCITSMLTASLQFNERNVKK